MEAMLAMRRKRAAGEVHRGRAAGLPCTARRVVHGTLSGVALAVGWVALQVGGALEPLHHPLLHPWFTALLLAAVVTAFAAAGALVGLGEDRLVQANRRLNELTVSDALTGLKNVRYFRARLAEAQAAAVRAGEPLSLLVIDLDCFKQVNDRYGHPAGDRVLRHTSRAISSVVRGGDTAARMDGAVARMGGEEFAVLLPGAGPDDAREVAERVLSAVRAAGVPTAQGEVRITASIGIASVKGDDPPPPDDLYSRADRAMYAAKAAGRDRVCDSPAATTTEEPALAI